MPSDRARLYDFVTRGPRCTATEKPDTSFHVDEDGNDARFHAYQTHKDEIGEFELSLKFDVEIGRSIEIMWPTRVEGTEVGL